MELRMNISNFAYSERSICLPRNSQSDLWRRLEPASSAADKEVEKS